MRLFRIFTLFLLSFGVVHAWDDAEMDIFDLVEEVNSINQNFYEYMELTQEATTSEIRKAYRKLSLVLHPDKSDAEDAELKFRWFVFDYVFRYPKYLARSTSKSCFGLFSLNHFTFTYSFFLWSS